MCRWVLLASGLAQLWAQSATVWAWHDTVMDRTNAAFFETLILNEFAIPSSQSPEDLHKAGKALLYRPSSGSSSQLAVGGRAYRPNPANLLYLPKAAGYEAVSSNNSLPGDNMAYVALYDTSSGDLEDYIVFYSNPRGVVSLVDMITHADTFYILLWVDFGSLGDAVLEVQTEDGTQQAICSLYVNKGSLQTVLVKWVPGSGTFLSNVFRSNSSFSPQQSRFQAQSLYRIGDSLYVLGNQSSSVNASLKLEVLQEDGGLNFNIPASSLSGGVISYVIRVRASDLVADRVGIFRSSSDLGHILGRALSWHGGNLLWIGAVYAVPDLYYTQVTSTGTSDDIWLSPHNPELGALWLKPNLNLAYSSLWSSYDTLVSLSTSGATYVTPAIRAYAYGDTLVLTWPEKNYTLSSNNAQGVVSYRWHLGASFTGVSATMVDYVHILSLATDEVILGDVLGDQHRQYLALSLNQDSLKVRWYTPSSSVPQKAQDLLLAKGGVLLGVDWQRREVIGYHLAWAYGPNSRFRWEMLAQDAKGHFYGVGTARLQYALPRKGPQADTASYDLGPTSPSGTLDRSLWVGKLWWYRLSMGLQDTFYRRAPDTVAINKTCDLWGGFPDSVAWVWVERAPQKRPASHHSWHWKVAHGFRIGTNDVHVTLSPPLLYLPGEMAEGEYFLTAVVPTHERPFYFDVLDDTLLLQVVGTTVPRLYPIDSSVTWVFLPYAGLRSGERPLASFSRPFPSSGVPRRAFRWVGAYNAWTAPMPSHLRYAEALTHVPALPQYGLGEQVYFLQVDTITKPGNQVDTLVSLYRLDLASGRVFLVRDWGYRRVVWSTPSDLTLPEASQDTVAFGVAIGGLPGRPLQLAWHKPTGGLLLLEHNYRLRWIHPITGASHTIWVRGAPNGTLPGFGERRYHLRANWIDRWAWGFTTNEQGDLFLLANNRLWRITPRYDSIWAVTGAPAGVSLGACRAQDGIGANARFSWVHGLVAVGDTVYTLELDTCGGQWRYYLRKAYPATSDPYGDYTVTTLATLYQATNRFTWIYKWADLYFEPHPKPSLIFPVVHRFDSFLPSYLLRYELTTGRIDTILAGLAERSSTYDPFSDTLFTNWRGTWTSLEQTAAFVRLRSGNWLLLYSKGYYPSDLEGLLMGVPVLCAGDSLKLYAGRSLAAASSNPTGFLATPPSAPKDTVYAYWAAVGGGLDSVEVSWRHALTQSLKPSASDEKPHRFFVYKLLGVVSSEVLRPSDTVCVGKAFILGKRESLGSSSSDPVMQRLQRGGQIDSLYEPGSTVALTNTYVRQGLSSSPWFYSYWQGVAFKPGVYRFISRASPAMPAPYQNRLSCVIPSQSETLSVVAKQGYVAEIRLWLEGPSVVDYGSSMAFMASNPHYTYADLIRWASLSTPNLLRDSLPFMPRPSGLDTFLDLWRLGYLGGADTGGGAWSASLDYVAPIKVELRDGADPTLIVDSAWAWVDRWGIVWETNAAGRNFYLGFCRCDTARPVYVVVRAPNHLALRTADTLRLTRSASFPTFLDFLDPSWVAGIPGEHYKVDTVEGTGGYQLGVIMWAGNCSDLYHQPLPGIANPPDVGWVNAADYEYLLHRNGVASGAIVGDLDNNGQVDAADMLRLQRNMEQLRRSMVGD